MSRRIAIVIGGLLLIGMTILPGVAQAAVARSSTSAVSAQGASAAAQATGPAIGADAELTATDSAIVSAFGVLLAASYYWFRKGQADKAAKVDSLWLALTKFREATNAYRLGSADKAVAASEVSARVVMLKAAAADSPEYGKRAVSLAEKLMKELNIPYSEPPKLDPDMELAALEAEVGGTRRLPAGQPAGKP